jgi:undecaprenyl diphosphate synthase
VNYRGAISKLAESLRIKGFVETIDEDTVKILAQGDRENLEELLKWAQRGTFFSKVDGMSFTFSKDYQDEYEKFKIITNEGFIKDKLNGLKNLGKRVKDEVIKRSDIKNVPKHIAIIPDGNRRWARQKGWKPWVGHVSIVKNRNKLMDLFEESMKLGIEYVTFWAFSTENWTRDQEELDVLFDMLRNYHNEFLSKSKKYGIKFLHIGRTDRLPDDIVEKILILEKETKDFDNLTVQFGLDYGGRDELIRAFKKISKEEDEIGEIDERLIDKHLDTGKADVPDPDLIIRTGGNQRTSGIMIWQAHYAELYFTNVLFPDFDAEQLRLAVMDYSHRIRRFGGDNKKDFENVDDNLVEPDDNELNDLAFA